MRRDNDTKAFVLLRVVHLTNSFLRFEQLTCVWIHNAIRSRISLHHLEFHGPHSSAHSKDVTFVHRSIGVQEIGLQVNFKEVSCEPLYCVIDWQHMDPFSVFNIRAGLDAEK